MAGEQDGPRAPKISVSHAAGMANAASNKITVAPASTACPFLRIGMLPSLLSNKKKLCEGYTLRSERRLPARYHLLTAANPEAFIRVGEIVGEGNEKLAGLSEGSQYSDAFHIAIAALCGVSGRPECVA